MLAELAAIVGPEHVRNDAYDRALYSRDASPIEVGAAGPVVFPATADEVRRVVGVARRHGRAFVPRGAGTGLTGGAVACAEPIVIVTTRMTAIRSVDVANRIAWVETGVPNLDISNRLAVYGVHFAPDPSSQQSCTIGGNVANNSGGPHCLAYGVTTAHVLAVELVLPTGELVVLGGVDGEPPGYDLRGVVVGSEGTMGVVTAVAVRLTPNPPAVATLLAAFDDVASAAATVSAVIANGIVPAALEMMDQRITQAVESFVKAGYPTDAAAVLLVEVDGLPAGVETEAAAVERIAREHGARSVRRAADATERALLWKGRKNAFGAIATIKPNYYLHDTVIPRTRLVEVLDAVYEIAARHDVLVMNVFHAGDGNLHPLLVYDAREPGVTDRVEAAGAEIVAASLAVGGVLSGEHGIGLEKRGLLGLQFSATDLEVQAAVRAAFDPDGIANPGKVLPLGSSCADVKHLRVAPPGAWV